MNVVQRLVGNRPIAEISGMRLTGRMGRFFLAFLTVALIVALTVMLLGARWGGFITGGVAGILIVLFLRSKWGAARTLD